VGSSGEQVCAGLGEAYKRTALVQFQPTALDRAIKPSLVFCRRRLVLVQRRPVEPLDQNAAVYIGLMSVGDLEELARRGFSSRKKPAEEGFSKWPKGLQPLSCLADNGSIERGTGTSFRNVARRCV
jgi:hypothetical protein